MNIPFTYYLAGGLCIGYIILIGLAIGNRAQLERLQRWLVGFLFLALLGQAIHIVHPEAHRGPYAALFVAGLTQPVIAVTLASLTLTLFAAVTLRALQRTGSIPILVLGIVWWVAQIALGYIWNAWGTLGTAGWLSRVLSATPDPTSLVILGGWVVLTIIVLIGAFYSFYTAHLPEIANRALFWVIVTPLILLGALLGASGSDILKEIGWTTQFVGSVGVLYGTTAHRVFDIRRVLRTTIATILVFGVTVIVILAALLVAQAISVGTTDAFLVLVGVAVAAAILYTPLRTFTIAFVNQFFGSVAEDAAGVVKRYSQEVSGVVDMDELFGVVVKTLRETMRVRRGGLLLATREENDTIRLEAMAGSGSEMPAELVGWVPKGNKIHRLLSEQRTPLLQYDLEYGREYADVPPELRSFFKGTRMSAYAPIIVQNELIGILAAGSKVNDDPFYPRDLELLATVANQTGVALRNARLVTDLRKASEEMQALNGDLVNTKERLEQLDSVKTDFITIASHELRTPLAQIRGYTDILDALNEQGMLDPDQMTGMTNNLRKATDRLERLIGDMLDVSQLGLDAMDLRFAQTTTENVLRLAIEPLTENIKQRKLTLVARGLRGLPPIEADMQRLVQAFRNIVTNAIKYTPDGGRIDISASTQKNEKTGKDEIVVSIQDTGIGIDPKNHELIFEKFFRVSDPGLHSTGATKFMGAGPGLGLTIARGVIQGHGGRIWVESTGYDVEKLPGSTFHIVLPVSPPENAKRVTPFEAAGAPATINITSPAGAVGGALPPPASKPTVPAPGSPSPATGPINTSPSAPGG